MGTAPPFDRLQPCLLDRLTDEDAKVGVESGAQRVVSIGRYKEGVLRDLRWLFNSQRHREDEALDEFPHVNWSVFNFGMRDFAGRLAENSDVRQLEKEIVDTLLFFEPRIIPRSLKVTVFRDEKLKAQRNPHQICLEISAELWAQPSPEQFFAKTTIDLESGHCPL